MKKLFLTTFIAFFWLSAYADEGMWMLKDAPRKAREASAAVVSYDFMGTGSLISDQGLVITNHHVTYGDVASMCTPGRDLLEDGFWARSKEEEIPIPGRSIQILQQTIDVTAEVEELFRSGQVKPGMMEMRRASAIIEERYQKETGLVASLGSFWRGAKYYLALYKEYSDIRLVASPPVCIAAFGGDVDNWEWPQQKGDFALVRIYTAPDGSPASYSPDNVPMRSKSSLKLSSKGYRAGSKTMVIGYPGKTDRFASSYKIDHASCVTLPISTEVRGAQMEIIKKWMDADPSVRMKYADHFFGLSNAQELYEGQLLCYRRFDVAAERRQGEEKELQAWIMADKERAARWGTLLSELQAKYEAVRQAESNVNWYRECLVRGSRVGVICSRVSSLGRSLSPARVESTRNANAKTYAEIDMRVEREIFRQTLALYYDNQPAEAMGDYQKELAARFGKDYDAMCAALWDCSWVVDPQSYEAFLDPSTVVDEESLAALLADPLVRFFEDVKYTDLANVSRGIQGSPNLSALEKEYTLAMYEMKTSRREKLYPNANSTLRYTGGKVCDYSPRDAVNYAYFSTIEGVFEKQDEASHDFALRPDWKQTLAGADRRMKVDFLTTNDITGGNSGSPVLDSRGRLIGLAFDGNKESLASDVAYTPDHNRCVCVDIRYVMWILANYAHLDNILTEINSNQI